MKGVNKNNSLFAVILMMIGAGFILGVFFPWFTNFLANLS